MMTDDQGCGDFGVAGNPVIQTPNLDAMAKRSAEMTRFYVSPVCSPTRASLMTGRWNYRTGVTDTWLGRSTMHSDEVTVAEMLRHAGYSTGMFGKWHLGDCYPYRPMEQGFDMAVYHRGGGLAQPSEPLANKGRYTDPILFRNGKEFKAKGYCTDVYFSEAISWIKEQRKSDKPFLAYIATNAPHAPFGDVPAKWLEYYSKKNLANDQYPQDIGHRIPGKTRGDIRARIFAMISNIDDNVGRLFKELDRLKITDNTLVIYLNDNGPNGSRYVRGFKGRKSQVHEGGIRSPLWLHWPERLKAGMKSGRISAHIDVTPTILDACGVTAPKSVKFDGRSVLPALQQPDRNWPDRTLFLQFHRGDRPQRLNNCAVITQRWKLVSPGNSIKTELYDTAADPYEQKNLAQARPEIVKRLLIRYDAWLKDLASTRPDMYAPLPIHVGTADEPRTVLTHQDWQGMEGGRAWHLPGANGHWPLKVTSAGRYRVAFNLLSRGKGEISADLQIDGKSRAKMTTRKTQDIYTFSEPVELKEGPATLKVFVTIGKEKTGPWHVELWKD